jgi:hypothetical protein
VRDATLLVSDARAVTPAAQRRRERSLLEGAALGETHLHVSTLDGDVVGLGAFHRSPVHASRDGITTWRRHSGGRATACGSGFVVMTLALPHRAALVADAAAALRPEQVMNRAVRGILAWLRRVGVDAIYPGLDAVTCRRREIARLGFVETSDGATLFQAVVAYDGSFASIAALLDRLDPEGRVPTRITGADECTGLAREARGTPGPDDTSALASDVAAGFVQTFPQALAESAELDPAVTALLDEDDAAPGSEPVDPRATETHVTGLLGEVRATTVVDGGRIVSIALSGDFLAPDWVVPELRARLEGQPATAGVVASAIASVVDGQRGYVLGIRPDALTALLVEAAGSA